MLDENLKMDKQRIDSLSDSELVTLWEEGVSAEDLELLRARLAGMRQVQVPDGLKEALLRVAPQRQTVESKSFWLLFNPARLAPLPVTVLALFALVFLYSQVRRPAPVPNSVNAAVRAESVLEEALFTKDDNIFDPDISSLEIIL